ncbi:protein of unknown function (plasmid) [Cupriavidus taiwanensis]|uniref:Uncharacterized protein n=1 Tax=Cupriavidus taiwanensis TaxID=164546 RepID=A0A375FM58_9BURK|nr:protein of unknown function [Cupriavidus taiwanensis]SOZ72492.1 protein of unknown function [Cupriavidus taiwanensis]SOZ74931.1 protein of unknown function [Cupriavidus taiwanensis]SPA03355.1 protein of unknown function [Cupriavidus taiwanensis]SPA11721.1 protein of unknown function [Cupriavidus taiwanensis]
MRATEIDTRRDRGLPFSHHNLDRTHTPPVAQAKAEALASTRYAFPTAFDLNNKVSLKQQSRNSGIFKLRGPQNGWGISVSQSTIR